MRFSMVQFTLQDTDQLLVLFGPNQGTAYRRKHSGQGSTTSSSSDALPMADALMRASLEIGILATAPRARCLGRQVLTSLSICQRLSTQVVSGHLQP